MKLLGGFGRMLSQLACKFSVSLRFLVAPLEFLLLLVNLCRDTLNPVAAIFSDGSAQLTVARLLGAPISLKALDGDLMTAQLLMQRGMAFVEQLDRKSVV